MPCELKGFRGLDISKGVVLVLGKAFLGVPWTFTTQTTIFGACPDLLEKQQSRSGAGTGHCFQYSARSLYAGHRLPPVVQAPSYPLGGVGAGTEVWEDNAACILMSENPVARDRQHHVDVKFHFLRER